MPTLLMVLAILLTGACHGAVAATPAPTSFASPEEAALALFEAAKAKNEDAMLAILGPSERRWILSGDPAQDAQTAARFVAAYEQKAEVVKEGAAKAVLLVGPDQFPVPFPIIGKGGLWSFDAVQGKEELLNRRIGRDETAVIETLRAIVEAQKEFAARQGERGRAPEYARKFRSSPGKQDGLYWPAEEGQPPSPLGPLVARAVREGDLPAAGLEGGRVPYHGYYFRILTSQGRQAPGGSHSYIVKGRMIGGFAVIAYPAEYGVSGVMTFMVNHDGSIFEADLGPSTAGRVARIGSFDPGGPWKKV